MVGDEALAARRRRYAAQIAAWGRGFGFDDPRVEAAFAAVPREACLTPPPWRVFAPGGLFEETTSDPAKLYEDVLVVLDGARGINNGQPSLHAAWMMAISPQAGETAVHIGAGSGYYTAILAELVEGTGRVEAYEIERHLAERARRNLRPWPQVQVHARSALDGIPPADVVYASAAAAAPPAAWLEALAPGGRLIFPWQPSGRHGVTLRVERTGSGFSARAAFGVSFIPCAGLPAGAVSRLPAVDLARTRSIWLRADREPDDTALAVYDDLWCSSAEVA